MATPERMEKARPWDNPVIVTASREPLDRWWRAVQVVELDADDPWQPICAAMLGVCPGLPDPVLSRFAGVREDLRFDEIVPVERHHVPGSLDDLISRITNLDHRHPHQLSTMSLATGQEPDTGFAGMPDLLPCAGEARRAAGPNIVVAVGPAQWRT